MRWSGKQSRITVSAAVLLLVAFPVGVAAAEPEAEVPVELAKTVADATEAWGEFAATGNLDAVAPWFATDGPQWQQFLNEANRKQPRQPLRFDIQELHVRDNGPDRAAVWTRVTVSGEGLVAEVFGWEFDLIRRNGRWQVWTVTAAPRPQPVPLSRRPSLATPATSTTTTVTGTTATTAAATVPTTPRPDPGPDPGSDGERLQLAGNNSASRTPGVRLPALSAWIIVLTIVAVAAAGYLAPHVEQRRSRP